MKKALCLPLLILFTVNLPKILFGQTPSIEWQKCYGGSLDEMPYIIQPTADGGYITIATASSQDGDVGPLHGSYDGSDCWIVKLSGTGAIQWTKKIGGTYADAGSYIRQTPDGGYIGTAFLYSVDGVGTGNHGGEDCLVFKLNSNGDIVWQQLLGGEKDDVLSWVEPTSDGGYILTGSTTSVTGAFSVNHGASDAWIVKLDNTGAVQWQKLLGGTASDGAGRIYQTADGGYLVSAGTNSNDGDVSGNHGSSDVWLVRLDASGAIQWQKCIGGSSSDGFVKMIPTTDGGYAAVGTTYSNDGDVSGNHLPPISSVRSDVWVVKINLQGVILWQKCFGGTSSEDGDGIDATPDGGFIVSGRTPPSRDGDVTCISTTAYDPVWVLKVDAGGNLLWNRILEVNGYSGNTDIKYTPDGGAVVTAIGNSPNIPGYHTGPSASSADMYVAKLSLTAVAGPSAITIDPAPALVCKGSMVSFKAVVKNVAAADFSSYQWYRNGVILPFNGPVYKASDFADGDKVYCAITITTGDCTLPPLISSSIETIHVSPDLPPQVSISADAPTVCSGNTLNFTATVVNGQGAAVYQWLVNGNPAGSGGAVFSTSTLNNGDLVSCSYSDNSSCAVPEGSLSNVITASVTKSLVPNLSISGRVDQCAGSLVVIQAGTDDGLPNPSFQWLINGVPVVGAAGDNFRSTTLVNGDVITCVMTINTTACIVPNILTSNPLTMKLSPSAQSSVSISYDPSLICSGMPVTFTATSEQAASPVYAWQVNGMDVGSGKTFTTSKLADGDLVSCDLSEPAGCVLPSTSSVALSVHQTPVVATAPPIILSKGQNTVLSLPVSGDIGAYSWSPVTAVSDPTQRNPVASPLQSTTYTLLVTSPDGCSASGNISVKVISKLFVPGAFSPNGDGHNEVFYIIGGPLGSVVKDFLVVDRWGRLVFQTHNAAPDDPAFGWDGRISGQPAPTGTYVYEILMGFADGTQQVFKGTVVLVR